MIARDRLIASFALVFALTGCGDDSSADSGVDAGPGIDAGADVASADAGALDDVGPRSTFCRYSVDGMEYEAAVDSVRATRRSISMTVNCATVGDPTFDMNLLVGVRTGETLRPGVYECGPRSLARLTHGNFPHFWEAPGSLGRPCTIEIEELDGWFHATFSGTLQRTSPTMGVPETVDFRGTISAEPIFQDDTK